MSKILAVVAKELAGFAVIELLLRAVVGLGLISLPAMNVGGFDRLQHGEEPPVQQRLYEADRNLIFKLRANADLVYPRTALLPGEVATWHVHTNDHGFRSPPFEDAKRPGVFRILCLGDSSTFGMNVDDADAYPQVLQRLLDERVPGRFEVLNLGVPGYSSRQGLELLRQQALGYRPDLVIFAFGTNDRFWRRTISDDQLIRLNQSVTGGALWHLRNAAEHLYIYRLVRRAATAAARWLFGAPAPLAGDLRVSVTELPANIVAAQELVHARGASLLVANNDFYGTDAVAGMRDGARQSGAIFVDMHQLFVDRSRLHTQELEAAHHLATPIPPKGMAVFRVLSSNSEKPVAVDVRAELTSHWRRFVMRDDGQNPDQVAGDAIWSALVPVRDGTRTEYVYWVQHGTDFVREVNETMLDASTRLRPATGPDALGIDTLGQFYLHTDSAHPDEEGHRLIAEALLPVVLDAAGKKSGAP
jgi:lysophospholipase L1-like esterase